MDRGTWWAAVPGLAEEWDMTIATKQQQQVGS